MFGSKSENTQNETNNAMDEPFGKSKANLKTNMIRMIFLIKSFYCSRFIWVNEK